MEQPGSVKPQSGVSESGAKRKMIFLAAILCVVAVVATFGSLAPGGSEAGPTVDIGEVLFDDEFVDDKNGWVQKADTAAYLDGGLHLMCDVAGRTKPLWFYTPAEFDNIGFEVEATKIGGPDQQYGLIFGTEGGEFFLYGLAENGLYCLTRWTGADWFYIVDYTFSPHIKQGSLPNTLSVCRRDQGIELFVNGQYLQTVTMRSETEESIGLFVGAEGMHVSFDNVRVYEVP